jgi:hypothetical protein
MSDNTIRSGVIDNLMRYVRTDTIWYVYPEMPIHAGCI